MSDTEPCWWTVREARQRLRAGTISRLEYLAALAARADDRAGLNAFAFRTPSAVLRAAADVSGAGPLGGIPLAVKDSIDTVDAPTTAGTAALRGHTPRADAAAIRRVRAAAGLVAGKNVMHELSLGSTSNNPVTGPARNPYDPTLIPGGSSGGTAVAVAAGMVPAGLGADTGGSVRQPAALCGIVGFRPTAGRYPAGGGVPLSGTCDTIGPMARAVDDVVLLDAVLAGNPASAGPMALRGTRIGVPENPFYRDLDDEVRAVTRRALDRLADAGAEPVPVDAADVVERADGAGSPIVLYELRRDLSNYLAEQGYELTYDDVRRGVRSPDVRALVGDESDPDIDVELYTSALRERARTRENYRLLLEQYDVRALVQPTCPLPARPIGQDTTVELGGRQVPTFGTYVRHTNLAGVLGLPSISLPAGHTSDGLPVGIELNTAPGHDATLLALAREVERTLAA